MNEQTNRQIAEHLINIKNEVEKALSLLKLSPNDNSEILTKLKNLSGANEYTDEENNKIVEGIFNGEVMVGPDQKQYSIPANYISKSKIVEGDKLKLIIKKDGTFVYKQIEPINRIRVKGVITRDEANKSYAVLADGKMFRIQKAGMTYFKGEIGDSAIILIPESKNSTWAALENIFKAGSKEDLEYNFNVDTDVNTEVNTEPTKAENIDLPEIEEAKESKTSLDMNDLQPVNLEDLK